MWSLVTGMSLLHLQRSRNVWPHAWDALSVFLIYPFLAVGIYGMWNGKRLIGSSYTAICVAGYVHIHSDGGYKKLDRRLDASSKLPLALRRGVAEGCMEHEPLTPTFGDDPTDFHRLLAN